MAKLFIYYSLTGNVKLIAEKLKEKGIDTYDVTPRHALPKKFFFRIMFGGFLATFNHKARLKDYNIPVDKYDEIIIGSPIWSARLSCPINKVLKKFDFSDKKLTFILSAGSGEGAKALKKINKLYEAKTIFLKEPLTHPDELKKLEELEG